MSLGMGKSKRTQGTWAKLGRWIGRALTGGKRSAAKPEVDVVTQLAEAVHQPMAAAIGAIAGGSVPYLAKVLAHEELPATWRAGDHGLGLLVLGIVLACAAFSMLTVAKFGMAAFGDRRKAVGFVVALEGVMLVAHGTASTYALVLLVLVNAVTNGCHIALTRAATLRRREADTRRQQTAAQTRARQRAARDAADAPRRGTSAPAPVPVAPIGSAPVRAQPRATTASHPSPRARRATTPQARAGQAVVLWQPQVIDADFEDSYS
jgi:hypothetical protein